MIGGQCDLRPLFRYLWHCYHVILRLCVEPHRHYRDEYEITTNSTVTIDICLFRGRIDAVIRALPAQTAILCSFGNDKLARANLVFLERILLLSREAPSVLKVTSPSVS